MSVLVENALVQFFSGWVYTFCILLRGGWGYVPVVALLLSTGTGGIAATGSSSAVDSLKKIESKLSVLCYVE